MKRLSFSRTALAVSIVLLAGCGGGSDSPTPTVPPTPVPVPVPTPVPVPVPPPVSIGATVSGLAAGEELSLANNGGPAVQVSVNGAVALPPAPAGSAYDIGVSAHPTGQFCEATQGAGMATASVNVQVTCRTAHIYVTGLLSTPTGHGGTLDRHTFYHFILGRDGILQLSTKPPAEPIDGYRTGAMTVEPGGRYAYVHEALGLVWHAIDAQGELAATPTYGAGAWADSVIVTPNGRFLYALGDNAGTIDRFQLEQGRPNPDMRASDNLPGSDHYSLTFDPTGKHAYLVNDDDIAHMTVGSDGKLSSAGTAVRGRLRSFIVAPNGRHAYAVDLGSGLLRHYAVGPDGALEEQPATAPGAGNHYGSIALSRNGKFMYIASSTGIAQFAVRDDGSLAPLQPAIVQRAGGVDMIVLEATGRQAYAGTPAGTLLRYAIGADGTLEIKSTYTLPGGRTIRDIDLFYR